VQFFWPTLYIHTLYGRPSLSEWHLDSQLEAGRKWILLLRLKNKQPKNKFPFWPKNKRKRKRPTIFGQKRKIFSCICVLLVASQVYSRRLCSVKLSDTACSGQKARWMWVNVACTRPRPPMLLPSADCRCTQLKMTKLWGPPCVSCVKALTVFCYVTAIFVSKNKINRKYVHLFLQKIKGRKIKINVFFRHQKQNSVGFYSQLQLLDVLVQPSS